MERATKQQWVKWEEARQWGGSRRKDRPWSLAAACSLSGVCTYVPIDSSQTGCKMSLAPPPNRSPHASADLEVTVDVLNSSGISLGARPSQSYKGEIKACALFLQHTSSTKPLERRTQFFSLRMPNMTGCWPKSGCVPVTSMSIRRSPTFCAHIWCPRCLVSPCTASCPLCTPFSRYSPPCLHVEGKNIWENVWHPRGWGGGVGG